MNDDRREKQSLTFENQYLESEEEDITYFTLCILNLFRSELVTKETYEEVLEKIENRASKNGIFFTKPFSWLGTL
jgi:hypothetical protein